MDILDGAEIKFEGLLSYEEIGKKLEMSVSWVKQKVSEFGITEKKIYKKKKYFDSSVLDMLVEEIEYGNLREERGDKK